MNQVVIILITALIFFILGMAVPSNNEEGFVAMPGIEDMEIMTISGDIQEINGDKIVLKIYPLYPTSVGSSDIRTIETTGAKFYKFVEKDQAQYQQEMKEFDEKIKAQMENPEVMIEPIFPPEMFNKQDVIFSDLKVGQQITVTAKEDIKDAKQFSAEEVIIQFTPIIIEDALDVPLEIEI
ncbi:MAG: hypothetical protein U9P50_03480 [Patescibacteria group bacterium]|nr:hypothetical protein [Patescibacteria group bacterium]